MNPTIHPVAVGIVNRVFGGLPRDARTPRAERTVARVVAELWAQQNPNHPYRKPAPKPRSKDDLSPTQLIVLRGMADGRHNREIGEGLGLSEDTIKTHTRNIFLKLAVPNRAGAVAVGFRTGLLRAEADRA